MPRPKLTKREYVVKVLDLIEAFGDGRKAINLLADKWGVHEATVYRWSSYYYATEPLPPNKNKLLRLWYYHCRAHKGDRRSEKPQDESYVGAHKRPTHAISQQLNPVTGENGKLECSSRPPQARQGHCPTSPPPVMI